MKIVFFLLVVLTTFAWAGDDFDREYPWDRQDRPRNDIFIEQPNGINAPHRGDNYYRSGKGVVDPRSGTYYNEVPGGYYNSRTGEFHPTNK